MAPAVTIDNTPDFEMPTAPTTTMSTAPRTLLLAPPTVAAHPEHLSKITAAYDRSATDIQMLDRLALGLVSLPAETYDIVLLLTDVDGTNAPRLDRAVTERIVTSMKAGGRLQSQDGAFGSIAGPEHTEAILAGLVRSDAGDAMIKPSASAGQTVSLRLGAGKKKANAAAVPANGVEAVGIAKRKSDDISTAQANGNGNGSATGPLRSTPAGVGFIDTNDDLDDEDGYDSDDMEIPSNEELERAERIDPDTLLTEEDRQRPLVIPEACKPNTKRRRACKDCTCGLAQRLEAEDRAKRATADANLVKLSATDLADAEVDFTVQGKVGSCGNCALGDAFRCDGCPYIGLPAFKPGEEVRLLNNDVQL